MQMQFYEFCFHPMDKEECMGKKIIIAEKPSVAREYAKALRVNGKNEGYIENDEWIVTWSIGHLVELCYPEDYDEAMKKWDIETLPFLPREYKYKVIKNVKAQFATVKKLYNRSDIDEIYYAGDSGREGLYIQMLIRQLAGHNPYAKEKVVWIDSQTEEEILRGVREAKDVSEYKDLSDAGYMRAEEDFATGINFSRALSIKYGYMLNRAGRTKKYRPVSVGRVMTCVLGMVVDREREIRNFKPTTFYKIISTIRVGEADIEGEWKVTKDSRYKDFDGLYENGFLKEEDAKDFIKSLPNKVFIKEAKKTEEKKTAPLLFNLAELQNECTKRFHISPADTLSIAQSLYEKKLTTYPRTDARVLTNAIAKELGRNLKGLSEEYGEYVAEIKENGWYVQKRYIDDSKVTDHYAIIPTGIKASEIKDLEAKVYDLIVRRFLSIYYPPAVYIKLSITEDADGEIFSVSTKELKEPGYLNVAGIPAGTRKVPVEALKMIKEGNIYDASYNPKKGETQPPKRYTTGSMVLAMENAGKLIEEEELREQIKNTGIGTSATRAETIEKDIRLGYLDVNKKTQTLTPALFGELVYEVVNLTIPSLLSPKMTASWEQGLQYIADGKANRTDYEILLEQYIRKEIEKVKTKEIGPELKRRISAFTNADLDSAAVKFVPEDTGLLCPACGSPIMTTRYGYQCANNKKNQESCGFSLGEVAGKHIPVEQLKKLIENGRTDVMSGFISKAKRKFDAALVLYPDGKIKFEFPESDDEDTGFKCPDCGKPIRMNRFVYQCECGFKVSREISKRKISKDELKSLIENNRTDLLKGFVSKKTGKKFSAYLIREGREIKFEFQSR